MSRKNNVHTSSTFEFVGMKISIILYLYLFFNQSSTNSHFLNRLISIVSSFFWVIFVIDFLWEFWRFLQYLFLTYFLRRKEKEKKKKKKCSLFLQTYFDFFWSGKNAAIKFYFVVVFFFFFSSLHKFLIFFIFFL